MSFHLNKRTAAGIPCKCCGQPAKPWLSKNDWGMDHWSPGFHLHCLLKITYGDAVKEMIQKTVISPFWVKEVSTSYAGRQMSIPFFGRSK